MTTKLRSNWMNHSDAAPKTFRAASNGKIFTRNERLKIVAHRHAEIERKALLVEMVLKEKKRIAEEKAKRENRIMAMEVQIENPTAKIKHSKGGLFVQGKNAKGHFTPAIALV